MDVSVRNNPDEQRYEAVTPDGEVAGVALYERHQQVLVFTHTEVGPEFEGQGVGSALAAGALDDVRTEGLQVQPRCSFIRAYIERHVEYEDLVAVSG